MYHTGYGREENIQLARKWYEAAIEGGYTEAVCRLGLTYYEDEDPESKETAFRYFEKASELSDPQGWYYLGLCYMDGTGVAMDRSRAVEAMTKSRDLGYAPAKDMLRYWESNEFQN